MIAFNNGRITLSGAITFDSHSEMRALCAEQIETSDSTLEIDLADVSEIDSSAIALLLFCKRRAREIKILNSPSSLTSLATLYGVTEFISDT